MVTGKYSEDSCIKFNFVSREVNQTIEVINLKYFRNMFTITFENITFLIELFKYGIASFLILW